MLNFSLDDIMKPGETMKYSGDSEVSYADKDYNIYLTSDRLLLHKERGLISKSDDVLSWDISDLGNLNFTEQGTIRKKGVITFATDKGGQVQIKTGADDARAIYNALMEYI